MRWKNRRVQQKTQMEISDTQATSANLGLNFELCKDSFSYFSCWDLITYIEKLQKEECYRKQIQDDDTVSSESSDDE
eukprot:11327254-Ditylum_brightwellii.AAC.1